jgi:hypothetical protein
MAKLSREQLTRHCAVLIEDAEAELRAIRAAMGVHALTWKRPVGLRLAVPLRRDAPKGAPPPLPL